MKGTNPITIAVIAVVAGVFLWYVIGSSETGQVGKQSGAAEKKSKKDKGGDESKKPHPSLRKAKEAAKKQVYKDHMFTYHCGCAFDISGALDAKACGYRPRDPAKTGDHVVWKQVIPMRRAAKHLDCWRGGHSSCVDSKGKKITGRKCCSKPDVSDEYQRLRSDLFNLIPVEEALIKEIGRCDVGLLEGEDRPYGACDIEADLEKKVFEPPESKRGDVARVYLYLADTYGMKLKSRQRDMLLGWHKADPPDAWEKELNQRIKKIQNNGNPYIENAN